MRTVERAILVDETGKRNGRGAYLCVRWSCWEKALAGGQLSRALSVEIPAEVRERLLEYAAELPQPLGAEDKRQYQEAGEGVAEYE